MNTTHTTTNASPAMQGQSLSISPWQRKARQPSVIGTLHTMNITEKLETFRALVQSQYRAAYCAKYPDMPPDITERFTAAKLTLGKKWARVDVGTSGKYMVEMTTGEIVGIKGCGVPHPGHRYGTLETVHEWDWSGYTARRVAQMAVAA